jgi:hypothetical protein
VLFPIQGIDQVGIETLIEMILEIDLIPAVQMNQNIEDREISFPKNVVANRSYRSGIKFESTNGLDVDFSGQLRFGVVDLTKDVAGISELSIREVCSLVPRLRRAAAEYDGEEKKHRSHSCVESTFYADHLMILLSHS